MNEKQKNTFKHPEYTLEYYEKRVRQELERAKRLHPNYPENMLHQVAIINEEVGEMTKAVLQYHYEGGNVHDISVELTQTAAMCLRMLENLRK